MKVSDFLRHVNPHGGVVFYVKPTDGLLLNKIYQVNIFCGRVDIYIADDNSMRNFEIVLIGKHIYVPGRVDGKYFSEASRKIKAEINRRLGLKE